RPPLAKNGPGAPPHLRPDARAQVGDLDGRVRIDRRRLRQLRARAGRRPDRPGRRVCAGLPAPPRIPHLRHRPAPAEDCAAEARVMDPNTLIASLQKAVPGARVESAPTIDLQTTLYVTRDELPALARV